MSFERDPDIPDLLWHFAAGLPADRRAAFCEAAESALSRLQCIGPGSVHRTLADLLSGYFIPPRLLRPS